MDREITEQIEEAKNDWIHCRLDDRRTNRSRVYVYVHYGKRSERGWMKMKFDCGEFENIWFCEIDHDECDEMRDVK